MNSFLEQIKEDIKHIQEEYIEYDSRLNEDYYAFNYWVLMHLFNFDENDIKDQITDRCEDKGIDAFVYYESENVLYLIQNKFRNDDVIDTEDINKIMADGIEMALSNGSYWHKGLQNNYTAMVKREDYKILIQFYVANQNQYKKNVVEKAKYINENYDNINIELYSLIDIEGLYYDDKFKENKYFDHELDVEKDREMGMTKENNNTKINSKYYAIDVPQIYYMKEEAEKQGYELFDENIRDFLGLKKSQKINNNIVETLLNDNDRQNFFYYNNGITILCDRFERPKGTRHIKLIKPKIINGCQTTNCIMEAMKRQIDAGENISKLYNSTYVFVKIFSKENCVDTDGELYNRIVVCTNSQNPIKEEDLVGMDKFFLQLQEKFKGRGFLLLVRSSDENTFKEKISEEEFENLKHKAKVFADIAGIEITKMADLEINLKKLLRGMLAFYKGSYAANNSTEILRSKSEMFHDFTRKIEKYFTVDSMIYLHLLFKKTNGYVRREPDRLPYLFMDFLGYKIRDVSIDDDVCAKYKMDVKRKLEYMFQSHIIFNKIFIKYKKIEESYIEEMKKEKGENIEIFRKSETEKGKMENLIKYMIENSDDEEIRNYIN